MWKVVLRTGGGAAAIQEQTLAEDLTEYQADSILDGLFAFFGSGIGDSVSVSLVAANHDDLTDVMAYKEEY